MLLMSVCQQTLTIVAVSLVWITSLYIIGPVASDSSASKGSKDDSDWTFQEGFCAHAPPFDRRLDLHSFAIGHGKLYVFSSLTYFVVPLGRPPFNVTGGGLFPELTPRLGNNLFRTYRTTSYMYTSFAIDLDDQWQLLMVAFKIMNVGQVDYEDHTQSVLWDVTADGDDQPSVTYPVAINAYFGTEAIANGTNGCRYHVDRFVSAVGFVLHTQQRVNDQGHAVNYILRYDVQPRLHINVNEYFLHPVEWSVQPSLEWYLDSGDYFTEHVLGPMNKSEAEQYEKDARAFAVRLMKNGYITHDRLYLTTLKYLEEYEWTAVTDGNQSQRYRLRYLNSMGAHEVIQCQPVTDGQYETIGGVAMVHLVAIVLLALLVITRKLGPVGHGRRAYRAVVAPNNNAHTLPTVRLLTDRDLYGKYKRN